MVAVLVGRPHVPSRRRKLARTLLAAETGTNRSRGLAPTLEPQADLAELAPSLLHDSIDHALLTSVLPTMADYRHRAVLAGSRSPTAQIVVWVSSPRGWLTMPCRSDLVVATATSY